MRSFLSLCAVTVLAFAASAADPPKNRSVKVGEVLSVPLTLESDVVKIGVEQPEMLGVEVKQTPDKKHITLVVTGKAVGTAEILVDTGIYYSVTVDVVAADPPPTPAPPPPPPATAIPVVPLKRVPPDDPTPAAKPPTLPKVAPIPPAKPVAKGVKTPDPTVRPPSLAYRQTAGVNSATSTASATGRATTARRAADNSSCGTAISATASTPIYARGIALSGGTALGAVSTTAG